MNDIQKRFEDAGYVVPEKKQAPKSSFLAYSPETARRQRSVICGVAISVARVKRGGPIEHLSFRLSAALAKRAGFKPGDRVAIDLSPDTRQMRLRTVENNYRLASWKLCKNKTSSVLYFKVKISSALPQPDALTECDYFVEGSAIIVDIPNDVRWSQW